MVGFRVAMVKNMTVNKRVKKYIFAFLGAVAIIVFVRLLNGKSLMFTEIEDIYIHDKSIFLIVSEVRESIDWPFYSHSVVTDVHSANIKLLRVSINKGNLLFNVVHKVEFHPAREFVGPYWALPVGGEIRMYSRDDILEKSCDFRKINRYKLSNNRQYFTVNCEHSLRHYKIDGDNLVLIKSFLLASVDSVVFPLDDGTLFDTEATVSQLTAEQAKLAEGNKIVDAIKFEGKLIILIERFPEGIVVGPDGVEKIIPRADSRSFSLGYYWDFINNHIINGEGYTGDSVNIGLNILDYEKGTVGLATTKHGIRD